MPPERLQAWQRTLRQWTGNFHWAIWLNHFDRQPGPLGMTLSATFERRVRDAIQRVLAGGRLEDALFEAKAKVPEIEKLALRLAGHANAARGQPITWVFGLDEDAHRINPDLDLDLADLLQRLQSRFDEGECPRPTANHHWFTFDQGAILAVEFDTTYPPYVIRKASGGDWSIVVPWRDATRVRAARRADLQRVLLGQVELPTIRPLTLRVALSASDNIDVSGRLLFSLPTGASPAFLLYEDIRTSISTASIRNFIDLDWGEWEVTHGSETIVMPSRHRGQASDYAHATTSGIAVDWVGSVPFGATGNLIAPHALGALKRSKRIQFEFEGRVLGSDGKVGISVPLHLSSRDPFEWRLPGTVP